MERTGIYPGSFDPVTNGHLDIIKRASRFLDKLYVVVSHNILKDGMFTFSERVELLQAVTKDMKNVEIVHYEGLSVNFAKSVNANVIVRGIRAISDFENEFKLFSFNSDLDDEIETVILLAKPPHLFLSSTEIKEICRFGGDISKYVPATVEERLKERINLKSHSPE